MLTSRVVVRLVLLAAVLCMVRAVQEGHRWRRDLTRQLVPALDEGDWQQAAQLVRKGADPSVHGTDGSTVLASVLSMQDVALTRKLLSQRREDLLLVSREVSALPTRGFEPLYRLEECVATLERVVAVPGDPLLNAWLGLGELRFRLGKYDEAVRAYETVCRLSPDCLAARAGRNRATAAAKAAHTIQQIGLRGRQTVTQVAPASPQDPSLWFALSTPYDPANRPWLDLTRATLALYRVSEGGCRRLGREIEVHDPRTVTPPERAGMFEGDLTGDGTPDVVVETISSALGCAPAYVEVFTAGPTGPKRFLSLTSSEPLTLEDLNGDGRVEVLNQYEIGATMSHVEQPRWNDVYAFDGERYVISNRRFPYAFTRVVWEVEERLEEYPGDWELLDYQGRSYEIRRLEARAIPCYRKAAEALVPEINRNDGQYAAYLRQRRQGILKRLRALLGAGEAAGSASIRNRLP